MESLYAIKVVWDDGGEEYLMNGDHIAVFPSRFDAEQRRNFIAEGLSDECQSINVVLAPDYRE